MWPLNATPAAFVEPAADDAPEEDAEAGAHGEHTTLAQLSRLVSVSVVPMLVLLGTFGNLLTLLVLLRPLNLLPRLPSSAGGRARPSKQQLGPSRARLNSGAAAAGKQTSVVSTVFYLCALSLLDLVYLYVGPALYWLFIAYDINVKGVSELSCRLVPFFGRLLSNMVCVLVRIQYADSHTTWLCLRAGQLGDSAAHRRPPHMGAVPVHGEGLLHAAQRGHRTRRRHTLTACALRRHARRVQPPDDGERARQVRALPTESRLRRIRHRQGHLVDRPVRLLPPPVRHHLRVQQCASPRFATRYTLCVFFFVLFATRHTHTRFPCSQSPSSTS